MPCIQAYNSLGESPCTIVGYMMTTCYSGEFFPAVCVPVSAPCAYLFEGFTMGPIGPGWVYGGVDANSTDSCHCNTISYSLTSACAACQNATWIQCGYIVSSSQLPAAYVSFLAGRTGYITAQSICLPRRESLLATEKFIVFDIVIGLQVPKSSPIGYKRSSLGSSGCHSTFIIFPSIAA